MGGLMNAMEQAVEVAARQEQERKMELPADPDEETLHVQADGFYGSEKGFHDADQLRKQ